MQQIRSFVRPVLLSLAAAVLALASATEAEAQRVVLDSLSRVRVTQSAVEPNRFAGAFVSADSGSLVVRRGPDPGFHVRSRVPGRVILAREHAPAGARGGGAPS